MWFRTLWFLPRAVIASFTVRLQKPENKNQVPLPREDQGAAEALAAAAESFRTKQAAVNFYCCLFYTFIYILIYFISCSSFLYKSSASLSASAKSFFASPPVCFENSSSLIPDRLIFTLSQDALTAAIAQSTPLP